MTLRPISFKFETLGEQVTTACLLEVAAKKAGNVHPQAAFVDLSYSDFEKAAVIAGRELALVASRGVGQVILNAVQESQKLIPSNANLGILLLLAPLAAVPAGMNLQEGIGQVLVGLDLAESRLIYRAIQSSNAGGLGTVDDQDLAKQPDRPIAYAMSLAAERDLIAKQYCNEFTEVLGLGRKLFLDWWQRSNDWEQTVIGIHLSLLASFPDSLIRRKCGEAIAWEASQKASQLLAADWPDAARSQAHFEDFDRWLRSDGHRLNPGTTADLVAAILFSVIRDRQWSPPDLIHV